MKKSLMAALLASTALAHNALAFSSTVYCDTCELVQLGVTPDQVQADVQFPVNNNPVSDSQVLSITYNFNGWTWQTWHQDQQGNPDPESYGTLVQSHFPNNPLLKAYWSLLEPDPVNPNVAHIKVNLCSDDQCTDWLTGYAQDAAPLDGDGFNNNHVLNIFTNPRTGSVDYVLDGNRASLNGSMPQMVIDASTNYGGSPFSLPIANIYYQVGCDKIFSDPSYPPDISYKTCIIGNIEEVFFYTGPFAVSPIPPIIQSFYTTSQSGLIQALPLNFGLALYGELPTVYLAGDVNQFPDGNAGWFRAQANPEVLPYAVVGLTDLQGNVGSLQPSVWHPYP